MGLLQLGGSRRGLSLGLFFGGDMVSGGVFRENRLAGVRRAGITVSSFLLFGTRIPPFFNHLLALDIFGFYVLIFVVRAVMR